MSIKLPLPKLLKWLFSRFLIFTLFFFFLATALFYVFFANYKISHLLPAFILGFLFASLIFTFLFVRLFHSLSRVFSFIHNINRGKQILNTDQDLYLDEEPGEFYELNLYLNQIKNYMRWQRKIISQESSELEAVVSALTEAILAVDQNKKILFFNDQATLLFSSQRKSHKSEVLLGEMIRNPDILSAYSECLQKGWAVKKTLSIGLFNIEEESSVYEITVTPLKRKESKRIHGAVGLFYDISNIQKTERIQEDFLTNVSHELRTPLTAIQGYVETLLFEIETNSKDQMKQFLNIIQRNVQRLVSLLNRFLDISKEGDYVKVKKETLSTEQITNSIIKDLHINNHQLKTDFSQKTVQADKWLLKRVLYNLMDNAIKYVPANRLIELSWTKEGKEVLLKVRDEGEGISTYHKSRLFERFYRVDPSRTAIKGAGIGLSIVKQLMERHGGSVRAESELNKGSTFICSFPD